MGGGGGGGGGWGFKVKSKVMSPETRVISPENFSEVAQNFIMVNNNPNILIALLSFHQIFENKILIYRACFVSSRRKERDCITQLSRLFRFIIAHTLFVKIFGSGDLADYRSLPVTIPGSTCPPGACCL